VYPRLPCVENDQYRIVQLAIRMLRRKGLSPNRVGTAGGGGRMVNHMYRACLRCGGLTGQLFEKIPLIPRNGTKKTFENGIRAINPSVLSLHLKVLNWLSHLGGEFPTTWDLWT